MRNYLPDYVFLPTHKSESVMTNHQRKKNNPASKTAEVEVAEVMFLPRKQCDIDGIKNIIQNDLVPASQTRFSSSFNSNGSKNIIVIEPNEYTIKQV